MVEIEDKIISDELFEKKFVCDLQKCKGGCCVEGDSGAPLNSSEVESIAKDLSIIKSEMSPKGIEALNKNDFHYIDSDGDKVTNLVNGKECVFVVFDKNNIAKCSIESAYRKKKINFNKPISCHLYPIRVKKYDSFTAINIDSWHVCKPACQCGIELNVPVFRFLKDAIVRSWGLEFFNQLDLVHNEFFNEEKSK
ncbi:MAG: DUF3109 family protein [Flavobacteriales bacterium]|jgi:hypothetical protein|tara:strand:+ start:4787 stop:5371 length:585 start_codon:yes stop_codon:yes gene_type:complete